MTKELSEAQEKPVHRAEVIHHGEKIIIPERMKPSEAMASIKEFIESQEQVINMSETFDAFPWDGAKALAAAMKKHFGWTKMEGPPGLFGPTPPKMIQVEVSPGVMEPVFWGQFIVPTTDGGKMRCGIGHKEGRIVYQIEASGKRKDEPVFKQLFNDTREILKTASIYKGKALRIKFMSDEGDTLDIPEVNHIDLSKVKRDSLILPRLVHDAVETNLFTPIERIKELEANGLPIKRGVLLGGPYGTGKTLTTTIAAKLAQDNGVTFLYVGRANELAQAIRMAELYQPAVVFCEDIDREMAGDYRTAEMDDILNIIDGVDTKNTKIMVVLTTNAMESINKAMLRPGRLDAVIEVSPPDAETVVRLVQFYGKGLISPEVDLTPVGERLKGQTPAVIAEVVRRAKLAQLRRQPIGSIVKSLGVEAIEESADTIQGQLKLMNTPIEVEANPLDTWFRKNMQAVMFEEAKDGAAQGAYNGVEANAGSIADRISHRIAERIVEVLSK